MAKSYYTKRKEEGLCTNCGGIIEPERKGKTMCAGCAKYISVTSKYNRDNAKAENLCAWCHQPKEPDRADRYYCKACTRKVTERRQAREMKKLRILEKDNAAS